MKHHQKPWATMLSCGVSQQNQSTIDMVPLRPSWSTAWRKLPSTTKNQGLGTLFQRCCMVLLKALVAWKCTAGIVHNVVCRWVTGFFVKNLMNLSSWKGLDSWSTLNGHSNWFQLEKKVCFAKARSGGCVRFPGILVPFSVQENHELGW